MRVFANMREAANEIAREIATRGVRVFVPSVQHVKLKEREENMTKELLCYAYRVIDTSDWREMVEWFRETFPRTLASIEFIEEWFKERISSPRNPELSLLKYNREYWEKYGLEDDGRFSYTYSERMVYLPLLIDELKRNLRSRQIVLTIFETSRDLTNIGKRRVPCSLLYQMIVRPSLEGDELWLVYVQRSCDFIKFWPVDVSCAALLKRYVANLLGIKEGPLVHFITSLHAFIGDIPKERRW